MRALLFVMAMVLLTACKSTPAEYYHFSSGNHLNAAGLYWIEGYEFEVVDETAGFMPASEVQESLLNQLITHLHETGVYASDKNSASYVVSIKAKYVRDVNHKQGFDPLNLNNGNILLGVNFSYQITVSQSGQNVLSFGKDNQRYVQNGIAANVSNLFATVSGETNASSEVGYIDYFSDMLKKDFDFIPRK